MIIDTDLAEMSLSSAESENVDEKDLKTAAIVWITLPRREAGLSSTSFQESGANVHVCSVKRRPKRRRHTETARESVSTKASSTRRAARSMTIRLVRHSLTFSCSVFHDATPDFGKDVRKCSERPSIMVIQLSFADTGMRSVLLSLRFSAMRVSRKLRSSAGDASCP